MEKLKIRVTGTRPLLMHNSQLADPFNPFAKALKAATDKAKGKSKNDDTLGAVRRAEWFGGLYLDRDGQPCLTEDLVLATLVSGARKAKNGKLMESGVLGDTPTFRLIHDGPQDLEALYATPGFVDCRSVAVQQSRVMRTRPRFDNWESVITLLVDTEIVNPELVASSLAVGGGRSAWETSVPGSAGSR